MQLHMWQIYYRARAVATVRMKLTETLGILDNRGRKLS